jgi:hypothetical protein
MVAIKEDNWQLCVKAANITNIALRQSHCRAGCSRCSRSRRWRRAPRIVTSELRSTSRPSREPRRRPLAAPRCEVRRRLSHQRLPRQSLHLRCSGPLVRPCTPMELVTLPRACPLQSIIHGDHKEASNRVHFTRDPPKYHPGITLASPKFQLSITQILHEKWT